MGLAISYETVFGLGFDVKEAPEKKSGFEPAKISVKSGKDVFGNLRLEGFAALIRLGFSKNLVIVSGKDRAELIKKMLVEDFNLNKDHLSCLESESNTRGNVDAVKKEILRRVFLDSYAIVTNYYHIPRLSIDLQSINLKIPCYPAEAFLLMGNKERESEMISRFGQSPLAERAVQEIIGISHKLLGIYKELL